MKKSNEVSSEQARLILDGVLQRLRDTIPDIKDKKRALLRTRQLSWATDKLNTAQDRAQMEEALLAGLALFYLWNSIDEANHAFRRGKSFGRTSLPRRLGAFHRYGGRSINGDRAS